MKEVNTNAEALKKNFLELTELKHILRKTQLFFEEVRIYRHFTFNVYIPFILRVVSAWSLSSCPGFASTVSERAR